MTVGATGPFGDAAPYSNFSFRMEISAPGGDDEYGTSGMIMSTVNSGKTVPEFADYDAYQGTSMAAPHVAGIAALMLGVNPNLSPAEIYYLLQLTATPFPSDSQCAQNERCGVGIASASAAVAAAVVIRPFVLVYEFHNTHLDHYFRTGSLPESRFVNSGAAGAGWYDTLDYFYAFRSPEPGTVPVCRFYGTPGRGPNSHFYTANSAECAAVQRDPGWTFEGIAFYAVPVTLAGCPSGFKPVYRSYNNRARFNDTNHRFTTDLSVHRAMVRQGWANEGVVFCVT
jgi:serine protease